MTDKTLQFASKQELAKKIMKKINKELLAICTKHDICYGVVIYHPEVELRGHYSRISPGSIASKIKNTEKLRQGLAVIDETLEGTFNDLKGIEIQTSPEKIVTKPGDIIV